MKPQSLIASGIVVLLLIVAGVFLSKTPSKVATSSPSPSVLITPATSGSPMASPSSTSSAMVMVDYSDGGFGPGTIMVKSGQMVMFSNKTSSTIEIDSNPHPQHTANTELNVGAIAAGSSKSVTLTRTGKWFIHNHLNPSVNGTIVVE